MKKDRIRRVLEEAVKIRKEEKLSKEDALDEAQRRTEKK